MAGNPREHSDEKGFWDRGEGHTNSDESGGRASGIPGRLSVNETGVAIHLDAETQTPVRDDD